MNKIVYLFLIMPISALLSAKVTLYEGTSFCVPSCCKNLAILGSTPHPTQFLERGATINRLKEIKLKDFLDIEYLRDSFKNALQLCMRNKVDHFLIAYLPGHFVAQRAAYELSVYEEGMHCFLKRIGREIEKMIGSIANEINCKIPITIVLPPRKILKTVPLAFNSNEHRIQHYIRSFPRLQGIMNKQLHIAIINNRGSDQNDAIMRYLSYEYVLELSSFNFKILELEKEKFHKYI